VVSMRKMDKPCSRVLQYILLCGIWIMANDVSWCSEHRGVGVYSQALNINAEDRGEIALFLIYVIFSEIGKSLDNNYTCPVYCDVDHKHRRKCTDEEQIYYETVKRLHRSAVYNDRKQSESYLRSEGGIRIECTDSE